MKVILRTLLFLNAILNLTIGLLLLASFIPGLFIRLNMPPATPAFYGQLLGVALLGFAWLQCRAAINSKLVALTASITGHVNWISGAILLAWVIVLYADQMLAGIGLPLFGTVLIVIGVLLVKLAHVSRI
ncbi:hypothetical protein [Candidatus Pandoraea novymonadis]|uniref:4-amino-4-deoxy-L-arabinose-phosphoundecaprenol flippase subunit ArnF n=1 Tax=Candidatus Pandoraea novymonadis TaxID=1808959 RepID=A0ABX5FG73_9BURK|nr:hypothetical protein [Candidatus Pandoraea novymonadis]PSB92012.1 hypothetical protein BZL35_00238 [Candidatus Pandoraea novymonadis]